MEIEKRKLEGLYLVIDPSMDAEELLPKIREAVVSGVSLVQIWDHWASDLPMKERLDLAVQIKEICHQYNVLVLTNGSLNLLKEAQLDGIHFDRIPENWEQVRSEFPEKIIGLTCGNDEKIIEWASNQPLDYLSFCAMFPSSSVDSCELVRPDMVIKARKRTNLPLFLSGGINTSNLSDLLMLDFQGVAIISGIMGAPSVSQSVKDYLEILEKK